MEPDKIDLMERQLAERVEERVRKSLFGWYGAIGAVAAAILGVVGWNVIDTATDGLSRRIQENYLAAVDDKLADATVRISMTDQLMERATKDFDKLDAASETADRTMARIQQIASDAEPAIARIEMFTEEIGSLTTRTRDLQSSLSTQEVTAQEVARALKQLPLLADQVADLASLVRDLSGSLPQGTSIQTAASDVGAATVSISQTTTTAVDALTAARQPTVVYIQYHGMSRERAEEIAAKIATSDFVVPPVENVRMPDSGTSEVRYFYEADRPRAAVLSEVANNILQSMGIPAVPAKPVSLVDFDSPLPKQGTLELWLGLKTN